MTDLKIINGGADEPTATIEQMAAVEFLPIKLDSSLTKSQKIERLNQRMDYARDWAGLATEIIELSKDELVAKVRAHYDVFGPMLMSMYEAAEAVDVTSIFRAAETRLAIALAVVESEPPPDDGGDDNGEPLPDEDSRAA
jgi:hypothetical protein